MKVYKGSRHQPDGASVLVINGDEGKFASRLKCTAGQKGFPNHSPDGHEWGYHGSGPAQLAHDLLYDVFGVRAPARVYQRFKEQVIGRIAEDEWEMTEDEIRDKALGIFVEQGYTDPVDAARELAELDPLQEIPEP